MNVEAAQRKTEFSHDRKYRFTLWRDWEIDELPIDLDDIHKAEGYVQFIGLNPSTADETKDDPTIRRCIGFAKAWGYGAFCMTNLFPYITPYPEKLIECSDADKIKNRQTVYAVARNAGLTICAWGKFDFAKLQSKTIVEELRRQGRKVHHLGLNADGSPKHPLYLKKTLTPIPF